MKCLLLAFFFTLCFVFTNIKCSIKSNFSDRTTDANFLKEFLVNSSSVPLDTVKINTQEHRAFNDEERGRICLKNITACMEKDAEHTKTIDRLSSFLFSSLPPFDLSRVSGINEECKRQSEIYVEDLKKFKLWALRMYDSTAKFPSGVLNGNVNQFGDFDMCLNAISDSGKIKGEYCLASMEVQTPRNLYLAGLHQLIQSHHHFRSKLEDPGHRVPRFSSINWALCVPSVCSAHDVEAGLKYFVGNALQGTEIEVRYEVKPSMCQFKNDQQIPISTYVAILFFSTIIIWELLATFYDFWTVGEKNKLVVGFSLRKNINSLISTKRSSEDIEAVHGIRCLNALLLLLSHKSMALSFLPYSNRTEYIEYIGRPFSVLGRAASLYTDPFIMISGTLTTYSLLGKLNKTGKINITQEYVRRLFRIVPTFAALIAFCTFILPWMNQGPLWNLVVTHHSDICKRNWWRNMLFIHNYFGFGDMCLTHTHHMGIDTQLFLASPIMIYCIWRWPKTGAAVLGLLAIISTIGRYYVTYTLHLSNYIHFGTSIKQLFATADHMYILPAHRATVYIMGLFLGYILKNFSNTTLTKIQLNTGNALALLAYCISFLGPAFMGNIDYVYDPIDAAWYAAGSPILWCFAFAWIIYTSHLGYKGTLGRFFSSKVFILWTKISYTVYLTQFPIFFYNVGITRSSSEYDFFRLQFNFNEYLWVIFLSIVLTLTFELPFQNVRGVLVKRKRTLVIESDGANGAKKIS